VRRRRLLVLLLPVLVAWLVFPAPGLGLVWRVEGPSMQPTIDDGSIVIVDDVRAPATGYRRGDIVILSPPGRAASFPFGTMIKRVVALPGEHVRVTGSAVEVDGRVLDEPYLPRALSSLADDAILFPATVIEATVPPGHVFVMGDHRGMSTDSTSFGPVPVQQLHGRVLLILGPGGIAVPAASPMAGSAIVVR
jgi:signal peptidase I